MTKISLDDARTRLAETVRRTKTGPVLLEDSGQPVAIVLSIEEYRRLSDAELRERERLSRVAYDEVFGPFDRGEFRELTDEDWQALLNGRRQTPHDPESWALPSSARTGT